MHDDPKLLRLFYSVRDFQLALSALIFFQELDENNKYSNVELRRFRCYLECAIISYSRPFNKSYGMPILKFKDINIEPSTIEKSLHDKIIQHRNGVVAHSDTEKIRLLVQSRSIKDDILLPIMTTDEGLDFIDDRDDWIIWLRKLISGLSEVTFDAIQALEEGTVLHKDYKNPDLSNT